MFNSGFYYEVIRARKQFWVGQSGSDRMISSNLNYYAWALKNESSSSWQVSISSSIAPSPSTSWQHIITLQIVLAPWHPPSQVIASCTSRLSQILPKIFPTPSVLYSLLVKKHYCDCMQMTLEARLGENILHLPLFLTRQPSPPFDKRHYNPLPKQLQNRAGPKLQIL
jgi:hypothetical protein